MEDGTAKDSVLERQAALFAQDARARITAANRWIAAFFFLVFVTWLNFAVDLSAGERGLPAKRVEEATYAASRAYQACARTKANCENERKTLQDKMRALNDDFDFVVFRIQSVDLKYRPIFVVTVLLMLLIYIMWTRQRVLQSISKVVEISKYKLCHSEPPVELRLTSAPPWLWPLPRSHGPHVQESDFAQYLGLAPHRRPLQAFLGPVFMIVLLLMAGHTIWAHHRLANGVIGKDFEKLAAQDYWGDLAEFQHELPHPMAFTGWRWLDFIVLIAGFVVAYIVMDLILWQRKAGTHDSSREAPFRPRGWVGMTRRTALVTGLLMSVVVIDLASIGLKKVGAHLAPRFRRAKPTLAKLDLPEGVYVNRKGDVSTYGGAWVSHFIRPDGTARGIYEKQGEIAINITKEELHELKPDALESSTRRLNRTAPSEAIEWTALQHVQKGDIKAGLELLLAALERGVSRRPNLRHFDLAAGLSYRKDQP